MFLDPKYFLFVGPGLLFAMWASWKVKSTFNKFSKVGVASGMTGAEAARAVAEAGGADVKIERVSGFLSDHYDPRVKTLRLSPDVYDGRSVAAIAVAAHEAGHAIQDVKQYKWLGFRSAIIPAVQLGSTSWIWVFMAGMLLQVWALAWVGVILFQHDGALPAVHFAHGIRRLEPRQDGAGPYGHREQRSRGQRGLEGAQRGGDDLRGGPGDLDFDPAVLRDDSDESQGLVASRALPAQESDTRRAVGPGACGAPIVWGPPIPAAPAFACAASPATLLAVPALENPMDRILLNYTNSLDSAVGPDHGVRLDELDGLASSLAAAQTQVEARRQKDLRWLDLPYASEVHQNVLRYAESVQGRFENVVVLGIGGSALGNRALHTALNSPFHELVPPPGHPRLFVLDNVDPDWIGEFLEHVDPAKCLFNVISKSGSTAETMSQFLIFRRLLIDKLGEEAHREHICVTTDAEAGVLRPIVQAEGYASFVVPEGVGGRFSVLSPVGLVSSALVGIDILGLLAGAADMNERCQAKELKQNPAMVYAALQWLLQERKGKNIAVTFAYSHRLRDLADWYAQLLGESIGKFSGQGEDRRPVGPTPVRAVGVTDQHSQVQLYVEGPFDKWLTLLSVGAHDHRVMIPYVTIRTGMPWRTWAAVGWASCFKRNGTAPAWP